MMTRGRAAASFAYFVCMALSGSVLRIASAADPLQAFIKNAAVKPQPNSNPELVVAEARLAELNKRILEKDKELAALKREAELNRSRVNAGKIPAAKVYRGVEELLEGMPKEAYPVAGPNGSVERAAARKWLNEKLHLKHDSSRFSSSGHDSFEWEATVQEVEDSGQGSYYVDVTYVPTKVVGSFLLGDQKCQVGKPVVRFESCTAAEVRQLRGLKGKKVIFRGVVNSVGVVSSSTTPKDSDQPAELLIVFTLNFSEISADGFRSERSTKRPVQTQELTNEKLLVAEARLADLEKLIPEKEKELSALQLEAENQKKLITKTKPDFKIYRSIDELLAGMPKDVYPIAGPNGGIERDAARMWLREKLGESESRFEWEATIKNVEDSGNDPFSVKLTYDAPLLKQQFSVGEEQCHVLVDLRNLDTNLRKSPIIVYRVCTAAEVKSLRALKGKKVTLSGVLEGVGFYYDKSKARLELHLDFDEVAVNEFLPEANLKPKSGRF